VVFLLGIRKGTMKIRLEGPMFGAENINLVTKNVYSGLETFSFTLESFDLHPKLV